MIGEQGISSTGYETWIFQTWQKSFVNLDVEVNERRLPLVGGIRSSYHGNVATGVIGTGAIGTGSVGTGAIGTGPVSDSDTGHNNMETNARTVPVTWTDVVRRPATVRTTSRGVDRTASGFKGQDLPKQSCFVSRSFSRNNPVNGVKV